MVDKIDELYHMIKFERRISMNRKRQIFRSVSILLVTVLLGIGAACAVHGLENIENPAKPDSSQDNIVEDISAEDIPTMYVSGLLAKKTLEDLVTESNLIIRGVVDHAETPIQVESADGSVMNFTDYIVKVDETFQGGSFDTVTLRMTGGLANNLDVVCEDEPEMGIGKEYIFFLYHPDCGGSYNTEGDYYYLTGGPQGLYSIEGASERIAAPVLEGSENAAPVRKLLADVERYQSDIPEGHTYSMREEILENIKYNLETGFITDRKSVV